MVLANLTDNSLDGDLHIVPTVHVNPPASTDIKSYAVTAGATATLTEGNQTSTSLAYPQIATFSARGPSVWAPAATPSNRTWSAPGVAILAAVAPPSNARRLRLPLRNVAVRPARRRSGRPVVRCRCAADVVADGGQVRADDHGVRPGRHGRQKVTDPYAQGAGRVPGADADPGLVYPAGDRDWLGYLEGLGDDTGTGAKAIDPSDYNTPSIAIGSLLNRNRHPSGDRGDAGSLPRPGEHPRCDVSGEPVDPERSTRRARPGRSGSASTNRAPSSTRRRVASYLEGCGTTVRIPMVVTPRVVDAPDEVIGAGASGRISSP